MRILKILLILFVVLAIAYIAKTCSAAENYVTWLGVCQGHCFKNSNGEISNVYDCCECKATITNEFEPNFHMCMCDAGYNDYCYRPVTNFLLSQ